MTTVEQAEAWTTGSLARSCLPSSGSRDHAALAVLLGLNGLRVSEACGTNVESLGFQRRHRTLRILGVTVAPRVAGADEPGSRSRRRSWSCRDMSHMAPPFRHSEARGEA
jgi:hypothetical protein